MEEKPSFTTNHINIINFILLLIIFCIGFLVRAPFGSFVFAMAACAFNFVLMIVFIFKHRPDIWVSNIIWVVLLPVIGFGCCAVTLDMQGGILG